MKNQSEPKKIFTLDDVRKAIDMAREEEEVNCLGTMNKYTSNEIIKHLMELNFSTKDMVMIPNENGMVSVSFDKKTLSTEVGYYPQHLYVLSNEEIKENDWFYCSDKTNYRHIFKCIGLTEPENLKVKNSKEIGCYFVKNNTDGYGDWAKCYSKKIIATTDKSLGLPLISKTDIDKYISEWESHKLVTI